MAAKKRTAKEAWESIQRAAEEEEVARAASESAEEVDAGLREHGLDPAKVREDGAALAARLLADRERLAWQLEAAKAKARDEARAKAREGKYAKLDRAALLKRLAAVKSDPRFAKPVSFMFRNHTPEEATEEQLRGMLEDLDALADAGDDDGDEK
jgi:hypothetical protein